MSFRKLRALAAFATLFGAIVARAQNGGVASFMLSGLPHIVYLDSNQTVNQMWWTGAAWTNQNLGPSAARGSAITSAILSDGPHIFYLDQNNSLNQLFISGSSWVDQNLGVGAAAGSALTSFVMSDGLHVFYLDGNQKVNQMWWTGSAWVNQNFGLSAAPGSGLTDVVMSDGSHIFYLDQNNSLNQLFISGSSWVNRDLGVIAAPGSALTSFVLSGLPHVVYLNVNQTVNQIWWTGSTWTNQSLGPSAAPGSGLTNVIMSDGPHVLYLDQNNSLNQLFFSGSSWTNQSLGITAAPGRAITCQLMTDGLHIFYIDGNRHVDQLWYAISSGIWNNQDLTGIVAGPLAWQIVKISGQVVVVGDGLSGVTVTLTGTIRNLTNTDANGNYLFWIPAGGSYTVTPSLSGSTFSPASQNFVNVNGNQTANFSETTSTLSINGHVLLNASALSGVTVALSGSSSGSVITSSNGAFSFLVQSDGNYTIVPSRSGYKFNPTSGTYNGLTANKTMTFTASSGSSGSIPVPPPPMACTNCGLNYVDTGSGVNPQAVYAPNSSNTLYAYCENPSNGQVIACNVSLSTTYYQYTNGHFHSNPPPPVSSVSPSSGYTGGYTNSQMPITLRATQVGQIEAIYISDDDNGDVTHYDYGVGYLGLVYIDNSTIFYQTGGSTTNHGDNTWNHYMTVNAATGLQNAATFYINTYNPQQKVCVNDMALPIGGKFDIHDDWQSPHISHDQGTAADVAAVAGQCPGSYIVNLNTFRQACINVGHSLSANTITEGNHVHCRWPN